MKTTQNADIEDLPNELRYICHDQSYHQFQEKEISFIRSKLLNWYHTNRRHLPWRGDAGPYITTSSHTEKTHKKQKQINNDQKSISDFFGIPKSSKVVEKQEAVKVKYETIKVEVSPYATWVSEIMCQQTRVDTVVDYFLRWMAKFPTIEALAKATTEEVNSVWAGLGYYRRARMLHDGAKYVILNMNGKLPRSIEGLLKIPGIGAYTAGAIASIAFSLSTPLVDGNVIRVLSRLRAIGADPKSKELVKYCWSVGANLVDPQDPGGFNQGLMELGATICTPKNPSCSICPLYDICHAQKEVLSTQKLTIDQRKLATSVSKNTLSCNLCATSDGPLGLTEKVTKYPLMAAKAAQKDEVYTVCVLSKCKTKKSCSKNLIHNTEFLMMKRPDNGLLAGQWEFPSIKIKDGSSITEQEYIEINCHKSNLSKILNAEFKENNVLKTNRLGKIIHVFSHRKHHMYIDHVIVKDKDEIQINKDQQVQWMDLSTMQTVGITTGMKKVLKLVEQSTDKIKVEDTKSKKKPRVS